MTDAAAQPPAELHASQVRWDPAPASWPSSSRLLVLAVKMLPVVEDDLAADLIAQLALLVADKEAELRAVREVESTALAGLHAKHAETERLRERVSCLRSELRTTA